MFNAQRKTAGQEGVNEAESIPKTYEGFTGTLDRLIDAMEKELDVQGVIDPEKVIEARTLAKELEEVRDVMPKPEQESIRETLARVRILLEKNDQNKEKNYKIG